MRGGWEIADADGAAARRLSEFLDCPEAVARVLVSRGYAREADAEKFLRKSLKDLEPPFSLGGIAEAAGRLARAVREREAVVVHGDFDADGIAAAALLTLFLRDLGARALPFLPDRLREGHGISLRALGAAKEGGARLLLTCDCGISSAAEVEALKREGIETIVTDHHAVPGKLPSGAILVNPKLGGAAQEHGELSGAGVAFMLAAALRAKLREEGFFAERPEPNLKEYLDIVALGTVADLAPLRGQNRILVAHGLTQLLVSKRPGIAAMKARSGLENARAIRGEDVGFRLGPRINAAARLGHAQAALDLLLAEDGAAAEALADRLESWNLERRELQAHMYRAALAQVEEQIRSGCLALAAASRDFHPGVIGLVAQKLAQEFGLPAIVFALGEKTARGSARTPGGASIVGALSESADLLLSFGGHEEAGGCTIEREKLPQFTERFRKSAAAGGTGAPRKVLIDAPLNFRHLSDRVLAFLERLRPFGTGNPEPLFSARALVVGAAREVGTDHLRVTLREEGGPAFPAIGFGMWRSHGARMKGAVEVAYSPEENHRNGRAEIQLRLRDVRTVQSEYALYV